MSEFETTILYLQIAILAIFARLAGEVAVRCRLPAVTGEILVGVALGPTIFRQFWPNLQIALFPAQGNNHIALQAIGMLGISLFLLVAGMEVDLELVRRQGKVSLPVSFGGILLPFLLGFVPAFLWPQTLGADPSTHPVIFALFVGAALSITSLPILAKTLIDLGLYRSSFGMLVISSAVVDDIVGWTIAGIVFSFDKLEDVGTFTVTPMVTMIGITLAFVGLMLTAGRWVCNKLLAFINRNFAKPSAVIGLVIGTAALGASLTQGIGIHGFFGAFMVGIVLGSSPHLTKETRESIDGVVTNFMAPLYFASAGLAVNFITNFSWPIVMMVLTAACVGKIGGCYTCARATGMPGTSSLAVGIAMNSRGSIEIVFGMIALQAHVITESMFVALAIMALVTSSSSGFLLRCMADRLRKDELICIEGRT